MSWYGIDRKTGNRVKIPEDHIVSWSPTLWNYKRGPDGKPMRDPVTRQLIPTSPKMQEQGKICPNLEAMEGDIVKKVVKWLSLRNRLSVLTGWMNHERLEYDGRLPGRRSGIASTHRQKHAVICNVPKASEKVLYGKEFRSLFTVEDSMLLAAADASGVEARVQGHYSWRYDGGSTAKELLDGDVHCFSEDTEILTEGGWKRFNEIGDSKVAQWDNGVISFIKPKEIIWKEYEGDMISLKNNGLDKLVTPNHRILVYNTSTKGEQVILAEELSEKNSNLRVYTSGKVKEGHKLTQEVAELVVAVQSDAYFSKTAVRFELKKERKIIRLRELLDSCGIPFMESKGKGGSTTRFYINNDNIGFVLEWLDGRKLSERFLTVDSGTAWNILMSYGFWDGTFVANGDIVLDTTSSETICILQALAVFAGVKTTVTRNIKRTTTYGVCYIDRIYISKKSKAWAGTRNSKSVETYKGKVGCVSVDSGFIVVRRNDSVCISGNSKTAKSVYGDVLKDFDLSSPDFDKEHPTFKPYRDRSKNIFYSILYGAGDAKVASTAGLPESRGKEVSEKFWTANQGTKDLKDALERYWERTGKKKYLPAIDGRILHTRKKSALLNTIFQSCGGIIMDYACCFMDMWLGDIYFDELRRPYYLYKGKVVRRVIYYHDEMSFECEKEVTEEVSQMIVHAIVKAGELLKLKVPLAGEGKVGYNWCETH